MKNDKMDLLEIDPKLFITCRLCLEDTGTYQIVPNIQQQIKYCFDIDVEPFDSLPQLLCKKCHSLLSVYTSMKKSFIEKQVTLKEKLLCKQEAPPETAVIENAEENVTVPEEVDLSAINEVKSDVHTDVSFNTKKKKLTKSNRRKRILSTSSTESANSTITQKRSRNVKPKRSHPKKVINMKKDYKKYYVCKICSLMCRDKRTVKCHYYSHSYLRVNHHDVFDVQCKVRLAKLDNKPNVTGLTNTVVFSKSRIIQHDDSDIYHILYKAKNKQDLKSDSSDNETFIRKQNKKRRLYSQSSNDTVFLGNHNKSSEILNSKVSANNQSNNNQHETVSGDLPVCINIDDSSDSDSETMGLPPKTSFDTLKVDMKTIENIITVCRNKYETRIKKSQFTENDSSRAQLESQLKHKLLSFGRKTLNAKGFNSTGLLRYLEHKNLNVIWEPISQKWVQSASREHSFVKIGAIIRRPNQRIDDDSGWTDVVEPKEEDSSNTNQCHNQCAPISPNRALMNVISAASSVAAAPSAAVTSSESDAVSHIVLTDIRSVEETNSKKLLNVNPVANPKQLLPKKIHNETSMVMPVITSTKSLAADISNEVQKKDSEIINNSNNDKAVPRIKVKPVSELMNPQKLIATDQQNHIWNYNQNIQNGTGVRDTGVNLLINHVPNSTISQIQNQSTALIPISSSTAESPRSNSDFIILDTVDMPNTKTESPFEYFRNLLQLYGIVLVEANADISRDYICLLKFKVQFKQENKSNPVTLCLSLHCAENKFCMFIKNDLHINIHIAKMSAIWQWEIIKIFQGDVSAKILHNAQKAGPKIYSYTNTFLCLLKSISRSEHVKQN